MKGYHTNLLFSPWTSESGTESVSAVQDLPLPTDFHDVNRDLAHPVDCLGALYDLASRGRHTGPGSCQVSGRFRRQTGESRDHGKIAGVPRGQGVGTSAGRVDADPPNQHFRHHFQAHIPPCPTYSLAAAANRRPVYRSVCPVQSSAVLLPCGTTGGWRGRSKARFSRAYSTTCFGGAGCFSGKVSDKWVDQYFEGTFDRSIDCLFILSSLFVWLIDWLLDWCVAHIARLVIDWLISWPSRDHFIG